MALEIDHVIVCLPDLEQSVESFESAHGVASVAGGRHRGHGTGNRLVPLGETYIELVAVVDPDEADGSAFGSWVSDRAGRSGADGLAIRTDDLEGVCARLGIEPVAMSRPDSDGEELNWRVAGIEHLVADGLPFFIQWDISPDRHPGRIEATHPVGEVRLTEVVISGDRERLEDWTGGVEGLAVEPGEPGVRFSLG